MNFEIYYKSTPMKSEMVKKGKKRGVQNLKISRTKGAFLVK